MTKILAVIIVVILGTISYPTPSKAARAFFKMCIYLERLETETTKTVYYTEDIPRGQECSLPPEPFVIENGISQSISYDYVGSSGGVDNYLGTTSGGVKCFIERRSIPVAD